MVEKYVSKFASEEASKVEEAPKVEEEVVEENSVTYESRFEDEKIEEEKVEKVVEEQKEEDGIKYESRFEEEEKIEEAEFNVEKAIEDFINLQWHTDDDARGKVSNILKGLLFSDDPKAKKFVKDLDEASNKLKVEDYK